MLPYFGGLLVHSVLLVIFIVTRRGLPGWPWWVAASALALCGYIGQTWSWSHMSSNAAPSSWVESPLTWMLPSAAAEIVLAVFIVRLTIKNSK